MNLLLESLIQEYKDLKVKLDKVADLIQMYGGEIPEVPIPHKGLGPIKTTVSVEGVNYPNNGTWKDKILYVLHGKKEPMTAKEIANTLEAIELYISKVHGGVTLNTEHILRTVTQYTSSMFKAGEISADDSSFRNKYFLKN